MSDETIYQVIAVGDIFLEAVPSTELDSILSEKKSVIDEVWRKVQEEQSGRLTNGTLTHFLGVHQEGNNVKVRGSILQQKHHMAHRERPDLQLGIKPIGVSGITLVKEVDNEFVIFAKRSSQVTEYPGLYELVPSGGIDNKFMKDSGTIDYESQLLSEFSGETGLSTDYITEITGFALVLDTDHQVYDVCCRLTMGVEQKVISKEWDSTEYDGSPYFVSVGDLKELSTLNGSRIVPTSRALIDSYQEYFLNR